MRKRNREKISKSRLHKQKEEIFLITKLLDVSRGAGAQACDCKRDRLWVRFRLEDIKYLILGLRHSTMPPEFRLVLWQNLITLC